MLGTQAQFTRGLVKHTSSLCLSLLSNVKLCGAGGPETTLFTSHPTNGYLWSLWPTNESYPCFWKQPLLLQGHHNGFLYNTNASGVCCCCLLWLLLLMFILSFYPLNKPYWPTSMPAVMQGVVYLPEWWVRYTDTHTHVHMPNMDSLMEDPLMLFLFTEYILFILVQSPALTPHLFYSAPSISLCLSALSLVYQPVSGPSCGLDHCG